MVKLTNYSVTHCNIHVRCLPVYRAMLVWLSFPCHFLASWQHFKYYWWGTTSRARYVSS